MLKPKQKNVLISIAFALICLASISATIGLYYQSWRHLGIGTCITVAIGAVVACIVFADKAAAETDE